MWRRLQNILTSLRTYADLSPDVQIRRQVNHALRDRSRLTTNQWFEIFWQPLQVARPITDFVYRYLPVYSGLDVGRLQPSDRLEEDLHLSLICWFDWHLSLCQDLWDCFGVDLSDRIDTVSLETVQDFVLFLHNSIYAVACLEESKREKLQQFSDQ
jgi:hypothetical protein